MKIAKRVISALLAATMVFSSIPLVSAESYDDVEPNSTTVELDTNSMSNVLITAEPSGIFVNAAAANTNESNVGNITITYSSEDENEIAEFLITGSNGFSETVSTVNGVVTVSGLTVNDANDTPITYTVTQKNTPIRYVNVEAKSFDLKNTTGQVTVYNSLKRNSITVMYSSEDGSKDAVFKVSDGKGLERAIVTDANGKSALLGLVVYDSNNNPITYTVEQINTHARFDTAEPQTTTIVRNATLEFKNFIKLNDLTIKYEAEDNNKIAEFKVTGTNYKVDESYFT